MIDEQSISRPEQQWKHLVGKNIAWIVIAASIWLTHFLQVIAPGRRASRSDR
jgi:hypothetical protein